MIRCTWANSNPDLITYHDEEWGVPQYDDTRLFEHLALETAQAGLSWLTILRRRKNYRAAFAGFDSAKVAEFGDAKVEELLLDVGIIRNRAKILATINNAQAFLRVRDEFGSFADYQWQFVDGQPIKNKWQTGAEIPAITDLSIQFSKDLKRRGFKFVGPTTVYAHMQSVGMVNDHTIDCFRYTQI